MRIASAGSVYARTIPFSFQRCIMRAFYRDLLFSASVLCHAGFVARHPRGCKDISFDIPISQIEHSFENILRKCSRPFFTSPKLIKDITYFTICL